MWKPLFTPVSRWSFVLRSARRRWRRWCSRRGAAAARRSGATPVVRVSASSGSAGGGVATRVQATRARRRLRRGKRVLASCDLQRRATRRWRRRWPAASSTSSPSPPSPSAPADAATRLRGSSPAPPRATSIHSWTRQCRSSFRPPFYPTVFKDVPLVNLWYDHSTRLLQNCHTSVMFILQLHICNWQSTQNWNSKSAILSYLGNMYT